MMLDLARMPPKLAGLPMRKVFKTIYKEFSNDADETVFIMPDGRPLRFEASAEGLASLPNKEIELEPNDEPGAIDLIHIGRSADMSGVVATNYAISIASALGANSLHIMDSAYIKCNDGVSTFPLSLYRTMTGIGSGRGWYANVGLKRGLTVKNNVSGGLNFAGASTRVRKLTVGTLSEFIERGLALVTDGGASAYAERSMDKTGVTWESIKSIDGKNKDSIIGAYRRVGTLLSGFEPELSVADYLKNLELPCDKKAAVLRCFPGYNGGGVCPPILLDLTGAKILEFPLLNEILCIRVVFQNTVILLRGGRRQTRRLF